MCGTGRIIWAKFKSFLSHIVNKHENLDDPLFNKCGHGSNISHRKWFLPGSTVYEKLVTALTDKRFMKAINQASPMAQTSCLEGFHSVLNHFCPKMISFSFVGMMCRHILAALHFNQNLVRDVKKKANGSSQVKLIYPKFKNGVASVRDVRIQPNYDYVEDIYQTLLEAMNTTNCLGSAVRELKEMTPLPMNTMLDKETRESALHSRQKRKKMVPKNVPPTTPLAEVLEKEAFSVTDATQTRKRKRKAGQCHTCKRPMKGHSRIKDCPRNMAKQS
ncbi:uncharacterized protein [Acropora muricata]|uniref:uncharacterized protein n=1 Tax=Acropora muricata TaxID=159855 RepID=UPI0034E3DD00